MSGRLGDPSLPLKMLVGTDCQAVRNAEKSYCEELLDAL